MNGLDVDFAYLLAQADRLSEIADDMETLSDKTFDGTLQNIAASWKGENASLYLGKGDTLKANMTTTAQSLRDISASITARAKFIYEKEQVSKDIATRREYE